MAKKHPATAQTAHQEAVQAVIDQVVASLKDDYRNYVEIAITIPSGLTASVLQQLSMLDIQAMKTSNNDGNWLIVSPNPFAKEAALKRARTLFAELQTDFFPQLANIQKPWGINYHVPELLRVALKKVMKAAALKLEYEKPHFGYILISDRAKK